MTSTVTSRPVISAWSAVSAYGIGRAAFTAGLRSGRRCRTTLPAEQWDVPDEHAYLVPDFAVRDVLGRTGTRAMDRVSGLAVTAVRELLGELGPTATPATGARAGLVLGTTTGSAQSMMDFSRPSFVEAKPHFVDAARFPNAVMNCACGQCAIWHGLKGPNATVAGGRVAGLYAVNYARRLLAAGRARTVLCGAVEEYSAARSWMEHHTRPATQAAAVLGEGSAVLLMEPGTDGAGVGRAGRGGAAAGPAEPLAEVLAVEFGAHGRDNLRASMAACVERALRRGGVAASEVWAVSAGGPPGPLGEVEHELLEATFGGQRPARFVPCVPLGDTGAAAAAFQLVAVLSMAETAPEYRGRVVAATSVDRCGVVGCALLRLR